MQNIGIGELQQLTSEQILLIKETEKYIINYCDNSKLRLSVTYIDGLLEGMTYSKNEELLRFHIDYNNYKYNCTIQIQNNNIILRIELRNNKEYYITLYNKEDFNKIIKHMYNDI